jgi:hypothetical protein
MPELKQQTTSKYSCTQCGGNAEVGYSNWSRIGINKKVENIVGKSERLCRTCFKVRTGKSIL